jgi:hypothetical protein
MKKKAKKKATAITVDVRILELFRAPMLRWRGPLTSPPPSAVPSILHIDDDGHVYMWQGAPDYIADTLDDHFVLHTAPVLFTQEAPFTISRQQMADPDSRISPRALYSLGMSNGIVRRGIRQHIKHATLWSPMANVWRAIVRCNRTKDEDDDARTRSNAAVVAFASRVTGRAFTDDLADMANACGMAYATKIIAARALIKDNTNQDGPR